MPISALCAMLLAVLWRGAPSAATPVAEGASLPTHEPAAAASASPLLGEEESRSVETGEETPSPPIPRYLLEKVVIEGNRKTTEKTILFYIPIKRGEAFSPDDPRLEKGRTKLLATGWFSEVVFTLKKGTQKGYAILVIKVRERPTLLVRNLVLGITKVPIYSPYGGFELADHNFLGRGLHIAGSFLLGDTHRGFRAEFVDPFIFDSPFAAGAALFYTSGVDYLGYDAIVAIYPGTESADRSSARADYTRVGGTLTGAVTLFRVLALRLKYRFEYLDSSLPLVATSTRRGATTPLDFGLLPGRSYLSTLSAFLTYDSRNDPFLPSEGWLVGLGLDLSNVLLGSSYDFSKYTVSADYFKSLPWRHVVRATVMAGLITGKAPLFERFYIGDLSDFVPDRVLGMALDRRRSFNLLRTTIGSMRYEEIAAKLCLEYIVPLHRKRRGIFGIDFFFSIGIFMLASVRDLTMAPEGYEDLSPVPLDLTANMGFRFDTAAGYFEVSVGTLMGLIPIEGELTLWK